MSSVSQDHFPHKVLISQFETAMTEKIERPQTTSQIPALHSPLYSGAVPAVIWQGPISGNQSNSHFKTRPPSLFSLFNCPLFLFFFLSQFPWLNQNAVNGKPPYGRGVGSSKDDLARPSPLLVADGGKGGFEKNGRAVFFLFLMIYFVYDDGSMQVV